LKITGVKTTAFRRPTGGTPIDGDARLAAVQGANCLVELSTDAGIVGVGIGTGDTREPAQRIAKSFLLNEDPRGVTGLWECMVAGMSGSGRPPTDAIAVLDLALWDLKAKARQEPLWKTLGAARPRVNVHAGCPELPASDQALFDWYAALARRFGFRGAILKVGLDQEADLRRLEVMRKALLPRAREPALMIDAAECWSPKEAIRRVREMEGQFDLTWVQEPARRWDFLGLKRVSNAIRSAVCAGTGLATPGDFLPHFHHRALDVVQVALGSAGITGALQLADAAFGFELPVALAPSPGNIQAHLAAALPYSMSMEVVDPDPVQGIFTSDVIIEDGWAVAGDRPGHGLVIDRDALAKAVIERAGGAGRVA
jgi:L-alanine-DL-glutamate epimerase-like enolase superfamily enzyme